MLKKEIEEKLAEILVGRIHDVNERVLTEIGQTIKAISTLKPTDAYKLGQIIKYGGSYEKIVKELKKVTKQNEQDIYRMFEEVARNNKQFAEQFYKYRGVDYIPYKNDTALKQQVLSIASITANTYRNLSNTRGIGFMVEGLDGKKTFKTLEESYNDIIDKAIISIAQGKSTFDEEMRRAVKTLGHNGLLVYESGRTRRYDSAVRMNILDGIRQLNMKTTEIIGEEYGADGVEISVHENPAPDHADIQGRQFSWLQYDLLEKGEKAKDVNGIEYDGSGKRHIGEYNCYHKIFSIIIGVSQPEYTDEQLKEIKEKNEKGFDYEGKHYSMYEGSQLQRRLELEIRKEKDTQILARESGFDDLARQSQSKINYLTKKYNELCNISGLPPKKQRMAVSGYRKIKAADEIKPKPVAPKAEKKTSGPRDYDKEYNTLVGKLNNKNINVTKEYESIADKEVRNDNLKQLDALTTQYNHNKISNRMLDITGADLGIGTYADASYYGHRIRMSNYFFADKDRVIRSETQDMSSGWHFNVPDDKKHVYTITHEYGHILEYEYLKESLRNATSFVKGLDEFDKDLRDRLMKKAMKKLPEKMTITEFKKKYFSRYAQSKRNYEWFAETFAKYKLGDQDVWTETFGEWLEDYFK